MEVIPGAMYHELLLKSVELTDLIKKNEELKFKNETKSKEIKSLRVQLQKWRKKAEELEMGEKNEDKTVTSC